MQSRIGAFGVRVSQIRTDDELVAVGCMLFGIQAVTIDGVWNASQAMTKKERSKRARKAAASIRLPGHASADDLDPEREERIAIAKARASVKHLPQQDPRRVDLEAFLRRPAWGGNLSLQPLE